MYVYAGERKRALFAKQLWSRAGGQGHRLKHMLKCNKYDNAFWGRREKVGSFLAYDNLSIYDRNLEDSHSLEKMSSLMIDQLYGAGRRRVDFCLIAAQCKVEQHGGPQKRGAGYISFLIISSWFETWKRERRGTAYMRTTVWWIHCLHNTILFWF